MVKQKNFAAGLLAVIAWLVIGTLVGLGIGYFSYVKTPAIFEAGATVQINRPNQPVSERTGDSATVDDSLIILSDSVLADATSKGRLAKLPEWPNRNSQQVAQSLATDGNLTVQRATKSSGGEIYEVRFRGATPNSTQQVVDAVLAAAMRSLPQAGDSAQWQESIELLTKARDEVTSRFTQLDRELKQLDIPSGAIKYDETLISAAVAQWKRWQSEADQLQEQLTQLTNNLRRAETMITAGAPVESILTVLGQPIAEPAKSSAPELAAPSAQIIAEMDRKRRLEERARLEQSVQRELEPLQQELDKLLERLGSGHPTVRSVREKMTRVRAKLDDLPPLDSVDQKETNRTAPSPPSPQPPSSDSDDDLAQQVNQLLRALRSEKQLVQDQLDDVSAQLDETAQQLAQQERLLAQEKQLRAEMDRQQQFANQIASRLTNLSVAPPLPEIRLTVLRSATPGVQIAPDLPTHLIRGGSWGAAGGAILSLLLLAAAAAGGVREEVSSE